MQRDRGILWEMEFSSILVWVAIVQISSTVRLHQTEHVNYTSIKIWFKWEPIKIFKKKKECFFFKSSPEDMLPLILGKAEVAWVGCSQRGRRRRRERNTGWLPIHPNPTWDQTHNLGMWPDQELNWQPFLQRTEHLSHTARSGMLFRQRPLASKCRRHEERESALSPVRLECEAPGDHVFTGAEEAPRQAKSSGRIPPPQGIGPGNTRPLT